MTRVRPARWTALLVPAAALTVGVVLAPAAAAAPASREPLVESYVALGDSYAAGPLIPIQGGRPAGCLRSDHNYPAVVARTVGVADFLDVSCSGATTDDMVAPQPTALGTNPPQLDALDEDTDGVTLTIGGNDIGFATIVAECAVRSPKRPFGAACQDHYTADGTDVLAERIARTGPKVAAVLAEVEHRSPDARLLLVGYPAILPDPGPGCFPVVPFSPGDVAYLRDTEKALNGMLVEQARQAGADYVDTYTPFAGHDVCTPPGTKWIEGLVPTAPAAPVHPNALGMLAMADAVVGELFDAVVLGGG